MTRARTYGHSIDNEGRSGLRGGSCNSHPGLARSGEGRDGDGSGGEASGPSSTGRGATLCSLRAKSTSERGGMGWVSPLCVEQGRMGVLSAVRVGGAGGREWCDARCMYSWGSKWTRQSAVWEGQKAIGRRLGELWVDMATKFRGQRHVCWSTTAVARRRTQQRRIGRTQQHTST